MRYLVRSDRKYVFSVAHANASADFFISSTRTIEIPDDVYATIAPAVGALVRERVLCPL